MNNRWEAFSDKELDLIDSALGHYADEYLSAYPDIYGEIQDELTLRRGRIERGEKMSKVRMKVTITGYYEADPKDYGATKGNPAAMAIVDQILFEKNYLEAICIMEDNCNLTVEPA